MTTPLWFGILFLSVLILIGFLFAKYHGFKIWTLGTAATLGSFALFYIPTMNYTWTEFTFDNLFAWSFVGVLYIFSYINNKFTTTK